MFASTLLRHLVDGYHFGQCRPDIVISGADWKMVITTTTTLSIALDRSLQEPIAIVADRERSIIVLRARRLDADLLRRWLARLDIPLLTAPTQAAPFHGALAVIPSVVLCCDARVRSIARIYADAIGAQCIDASDTTLAREMLCTPAGVRSVTLFVLSDALSEPLCNAIWSGNQLRRHTGNVCLPFGVMCGSDEDHLAWLVAKTLVILVGAPLPERIGLLEHDGFLLRNTARFISRAQGALTIEAPPRMPWTSDDFHAAAVFTHGVSYDASLGDVALCGRPNRLLPLDRLHRVPSCLIDGHCFRIEQPGGPRARLLASHTTPLVWFLNSCAAVPLSGHAFGTDASYTSELLAGAAVGVIGSYIVQVTSAERSRIFDGLLRTGLTLGEIAQALTELVAEAGFPSYLLLGSPDLRLLPECTVAGVCDQRGYRYDIRSALGAVRLRLADETAMAVVADDGSPVWSDATAHVVTHAGEQDLLVQFDESRPVDGWLVMAPLGRSAANLREEIAALARRLSTLKLYSFAAAEGSQIEGCEALVHTFAACAEASSALRHYIWLAAFQARMELSLTALHETLARAFLRHMTDGDFNFDRESYNGFVPEPPVRTDRRCVTCQGALFTSLEKRNDDSGWVRQKVICVHCLGVALTPKDSPLQVEQPRLYKIDKDGVAEIIVSLRGRSGSLDVVAVAALRKGDSLGSDGPVMRRVSDQMSEEIRFRVPIKSGAGTRSIRLLLLARGSAEFYSVLLPAPTVKLRERQVQ
jgi:hypothetical protein